jgi:hypothetical protein
MEPQGKHVAGDGASVTDRPTARYLGRRTPTGVVVVREDDRGEARELPQRTDLRNHSPTGFEWGYGGSGPAQLALAILADAVGAERAQGLYQRFKWKVVAKFAGEGFELTRSQVKQWVEEHSDPDERKDLDP